MGRWVGELIPSSAGTNSGREENFCSKFTVSRTLSIPSSRITFLKKLFLFPESKVLTPKFDSRPIISGFVSVGVDGSDSDGNLAFICAGVGARMNFGWPQTSSSSLVRATGSVGRLTLETGVDGAGGSGCLMVVIPAGTVVDTESGMRLYWTLVTAIMVRG